MKMRMEAVAAVRDFERADRALQADALGKPLPRGASLDPTPCCSDAGADGLQVVAEAMSHGQSEQVRSVSAVPFDCSLDLLRPLRPYAESARGTLPHGAAEHQAPHTDVPSGVPDDLYHAVDAHPGTLGYPPTGHTSQAVAKPLHLLTSSLGGFACRDCDALRGNSVRVLSKRRGAARRARGSAPHPGEPFIGAHPAVQEATAERHPRIPLPVCAHVAREALRNPATRLSAPEGAPVWCVCFCACDGAFGRAYVRFYASSCSLSSIVPFGGASP